VVTRTCAALALALAACLALAGCWGGDDGGDDDEQRIADVLTAGLTSEDPQVVCAETLSAGLVRRVYGSDARCRVVERRTARRSDPAEEVDVSGTSVDGDRATAVVALRGGDPDGARGEVGLLRQDEDWRLDELSPALLRSLLEARLRGDRALRARARACAVRRVLALDDAALGELALGAMGERAPARRRLDRITGDCRERAAAVVLRGRLEGRIAASLRAGGAAPGTIACVRRELRRALSDAEVVELAGRRGERIPSKVDAVTSFALSVCSAAG
jgi:hypothetical protein